VLVEISDTTLRYDQRVKLPLYARHAIPHVLNVEMTSGAVVHYSEPGEGGYRQSRRYAPGERLTLDILPDVAISLAVDDLFK
jgi:hypothetical protein